MTSLDSAEGGTGSKGHDSPEKTQDSIGQKRIDAAFVESAHSHMYEEIRTIPTGKYYKSPVVDKFERGGPIANMGKE